METGFMQFTVNIQGGDIKVLEQVYSKQYRRQKLKKGER